MTLKSASVPRSEIGPREHHPAKSASTLVLVRSRPSADTSPILPDRKVPTPPEARREQHCPCSRHSGAPMRETSKKAMVNGSSSHGTVRAEGSLAAAKTPSEPVPEDHSRFHFPMTPFRTYRLVKPLYADPLLQSITKSE